MAITWRNVAGGGSNSGAGLAQSGSDLVSRGLNSLRQFAAEQQKLNIQNDRLITEKNTNDYLDQVAQYTSAADLSNPETQAQLMQLRDGYGQMIDRAATRAAVDTRLMNLQKQELAANQFADQAQERAQRPLIEQLTEAGRRGDKATVNKILEENSFINEDQIARTADQQLDAVTTRAYQAENQARAGRAEQRAVEQFNLSKQVQQANLSDRQEARQIRRDTNLLTAAELELKSSEAALRASNPLANVSTDPIKDSNDSVRAVADKIEPWTWGDGDTINNLTNRVASYMQDGVNLGDDIGKVRIPKAVIDQYLTQASTESFRSEGSLLSDMDDWIKTYAVSNPGLFRRASEVGQQIQQLREASKAVNAGKIQVLRGQKLDSDSLSGTIETIRSRVPTNTR